MNCAPTNGRQEGIPDGAGKNNELTRTRLRQAAQNKGCVSEVATTAPVQEGSQQDVTPRECRYFNFRIESRPANSKCLSNSSNVLTTYIAIREARDTISP